MSGDKMIRLSGIAYESLVNGPGIRRVFFAQGCKHKCAGCFNPETHSFEGGKLLNLDEIVKDIEGNPLLKGVTFSGGDPLEQAEEFAYIGKKAKEFGMNVWIYTGYTYEYILKNKEKIKGWNELLSIADVVIDGKYEESKQGEALKYRGSSNQRIIDVKRSFKEGKTIELNFD